MVKEISITDALQMKNACMVDVRSEGEFAEGAIPGAVNVPVFNNDERARVGTTYKQIGTEEAKLLGFDIAGPKLARLYDQLTRLGQGKDLVLYCWRGGMRSKYTAEILHSLGLNLYRIQGGYKAYRRYIYNYLDRDTIQHKAVVLHGLTGVGKTRILQKLIMLGYPVLDLEELARHRGSTYGKVGLPPSPSQKDFEAEIVQTLVAAENNGVIIVECESRRVGKLIVPPSVFKSMNNGYRVLLYAPIKQRVERILEDYTIGPNNNVAELQDRTSRLIKSLGSKKIEELNMQIELKNFDVVIEYLLKEYYDPLYKYPNESSDNYDLSVDCTDLDYATDIIAKWVCSLPEYSISVKNGGENHANWGNLEKCQDGEGLFS